MNADWSKLIPASAGSGKTFTLMKLLSHGLMGKPWAADPDSEDPALPAPLSAERIVAVTFTEAAAQELRQRIRGDLLQSGRLDDAARLDEAYVSTIHSFGLRLLRETAFDRGGVLSPRLLTEDEQKQLMRRALGQSNLIGEITRDLGRFGYRYDFNSKTSAADSFRTHVLAVIALLDAVAEARPLEDIIADARRRAAELYGTTLDEEPEFLAARLADRVNALLEAFPNPLTESHGTSKSARAAFSENYRALKSTSRERLLHDWALWVELCDLRKSKRGCPTPDGYDDLADAVMDAAKAIHSHTGPLQAAQDHIETLLRAAQDAMQRYAAFKHDAGLLDYGDMVTQALGAMADEEIRALAIGRVDCVVIDEFQDTNPQQFGLLWNFIRGGLPSVIVGDMKQSIMGFQGADPRLFGALLKAYEGLQQPLTRNWRSQPRLMDIINSVSRGLFPDYRPLEPKGAASDLPPLHVVAMPDRAHCKTDKWRAARISEVLAQKLNDPAYAIVDRHSKQRRRLRGGDCAVLCPTHTMLGHYAAALRNQGLKVRLKQGGWIESEEVRLALEALALLQDPNDRHARLYLAVTELGSHTLESALKLMLAGEELEDPCFAPLIGLADEAQRLTVDILVPRALEAMGLFDAVMNWPQARQARANLLKLEGLAREFVNAQPESRMAAGIYGTGLPQFLCWVRQQADNDDNMPPPSVIDEDAVELVTWHASKGREWPVVAVCGLAQKVEPRLPDLQLEYSSFDDLDELIRTASIAWSPSFDSPDASERIREHLVAGEVDETLREIYVAITRPRDQLLLEWPLDAVSAEKTTRASLLNDRVGLTLEEGSVSFASGEVFEAIVEHVELPVEAHEGDEVLLSPPGFGRIALEPRSWAGVLTPDARAPTAEHDQSSGEVPQFREIRYAEPLKLPPHPDPLAVGSFVHRCFEIGFEGARCSGYLEASAESLWPGNGQTAVQSVKRAAEAFDAALNAEFGVVDADREVPITGLDREGIVVSGIVDLLARTPNGLIVVDHKTDRSVEAETLVQRHLGQLRDYSDQLGEEGVRGLVINAVSLGSLIVIDESAPAGEPAK